MTLIICEDRKKLLDAKGHILVTGGPGSGKTTIALKKALVRIEEGLEEGQKVLFLSFSRAAVARIIQSAEEWVPRDLLPKLSVHTFHSFFWQILKTYGYLLNAPKKIRILLPHDEKVRNSGIEEDNLLWSGWVIERERIFTEEGLIAFDLFSAKTFDILRRSSRITKLICSCYPLVVVDEAQDTDSNQWACIHKMAEHCQLLCLADLEQQIYDFRPGVSAERVSNIVSTLNPLRIDLGTQNNRSPNVEIVQFGNDVLLNTPRQGGYRGVSRIQFNPKAEIRDRLIRGAVGRIYDTIETDTGIKPRSVAVLSSWGKGVTVISNALRGTDPNKEILHRVIFDETGALLSSRIFAFMLEPKFEDNESIDLSFVLHLLSEYFNAKGSKTGRDNASKYKAAIEILAEKGSLRDTKLTRFTKNTFVQIRSGLYTGNPHNDWLKLRSIFRESDVKEAQMLNTSAQYLMAFNRGKQIAARLSESWKEFGEYRNARDIVEKTLTEEQLAADNNDHRGIHVMTIHKSKGKEYDGVVIFDESRLSPLRWGPDNPPFIRNRKLLRVGITRAKLHVLLLTDRITPTPLLNGFHL